MQVVVTVAGLGQRFQFEGFAEPKPIVPVMGKAAITYLIESFNPNWNLFFAIGDHFKDTNIEKVIKKSCPGAVIVYVPHSSRGPVDTVLSVLPRLDFTKPVAVSYCDYAMIWQPALFENFLAASECDVCIPAYKGFHPTYLGPNTYAHLKVDEKTNRVHQIQEKKLFGNNIEDEWSSPGFYFFKSVELLEKAMALQLRSDLKYGSEFYTSLAAQALMNDDSTAKIMFYRVSHFLQMGTPADLTHVEYWHKFIVQDQKTNTFQTGSKEDKLFGYWSHVFKIIFEA